MTEQDDLFSLYSGWKNKADQDVLYSLANYPLTAHESFIVIDLLEKLKTYRELQWLQYGKGGIDPFRSGLNTAISYFTVMGDAKAEQEHQDAFCTPIIEGS